MPKLHRSYVLSVVEWSLGMANYLAVELYTRILLDPLKSIADITEENKATNFKN